jgi:hypothetical protein
MVAISQTGLELEGQRIGYTVRVSTKRQEDNWSTVEQEGELLRFIRERGGTPIAYDEGAVSGRDLSKRHVALRMLADVASGELNGIAAYDLKRLSRDEYGADPALILKRLAARRAVLVLHNKIVRPWDKDDRTYFQLGTLLAGRDIVDIRDTFWRGLFARARHEVFFMGVPPFGYRTRIIELPAGNGKRAKVRRIPGKDPAHAEAMADLAAWLDECPNLGEVARRFNEKYPTILPAAGRRRKHGDQRIMYSTQLRAMLENPMYRGEWVFGRNPKYIAGQREQPRQNSVWDINQRRERNGEFEHHVPELAYWTKAKVLYWQRKFSRADDRPTVRTRKHVHPLLGVLACATCGRTMTGSGSVAGNGLYRCPGATDQRCADPQGITESRARALLSDLIPEVFERMRARWTDIGARQLLGEGEEVVKLRRALQTKRDQLATLEDEWYGEEAQRAGLRPSLNIRQRISDLAREIEEMAERLGEAEAEAAVDRGMAQKVATLLTIGDPQHRLGTLGPDDQAAFYRQYLRDVRIRGKGVGMHRKHEVVRPFTILAGSAAISSETVGS